MMEWISVKDRMPTKSGDYLVSDGDAQMVAAYYPSSKFDFFYNDRFWDHESVTHWMPLPKPPKQ